jgi:hypothetical protein
VTPPRAASCPRSCRTSEVHAAPPTSAQASSSATTSLHSSKQQGDIVLESACCKRIFQVFQMFHLDVPCVSSRYCICCNGYTRMLQVYVPNVSTVFRHTLQVYVPNVSAVFRRMLQVYVSNVSAVLDVCCKFFLDVAYIYCSGYTHMLQAYVLNISHVSGVYCSKCLMLQVFSLAGAGSERRWRRRQSGRHTQCSSMRSSSRRACIVVACEAAAGCLNSNRHIRLDCFVC